MTLHLPAASSVGRAFECDGSVCLPQIRTSSDASAHGHEVHRDVADEDPETIEGLHIEPGTLHETAVAWNHKTGVARLLGYNLKTLPPRQPDELRGVVDLLKPERRPLHIGDVKTGKDEVARNSWQMKTLAVMVAALYGVDEVEVALHFRRGDSWRHDSAVFDWGDLASFADDLRRKVARWEEAQRLFDGGGAEALARARMIHAGPWCRYCSSLPYCPSQTQLASSMLGELMGAANELTPEQAGVAWYRLDMIDLLSATMRTALRRYAEQCPVPLPGGKVLREVPIESNERAVPETVLRVLRDAGLPRELVNAAVPAKLSSSKAAIRRAFALHERPKREAEAAIRDVREAGGFVSSWHMEVRAVEDPVSSALPHDERKALP